MLSARAFQNSVIASGTRFAREIFIERVLRAEYETYVHSWDCCSIPSSRTGRGSLRNRLCLLRQSLVRRPCKSSIANECPGRKWPNTATSPSSSSRLLCTAAGCKLAPSRSALRNQKIGSRPRMFLFAVDVHQNKDVSIQSSRTTLTIRLRKFQDLQ